MEDTTPGGRGGERVRGRGVEGERESDSFNLFDLVLSFSWVLFENEHPSG